MNSDDRIKFQIWHGDGCFAYIYIYNVSLYHILKWAMLFAENTKRIIIFMKGQDNPKPMAMRSHHMG